MKISGLVLIIDDEISLRTTLKRILDLAGCETMVAADGSQALALLSRRHFDLVYLDIHLPDIDGLQILGEIRKRDADLPVVLLTGHGSLHSAVEALRLGAADYLLKPLDPEVLVARTRTLLKEREVERKRTQISERIAVLQKELQALDREFHPQASPPSPYPKTQDRFIKIGKLILDLQAKSATFGEDVLSLPPTAFDYLTVLARHSPDVVNYQVLVFEAQDYRVETSEASELAKWHIHVLRQAFDSDDRTPRFIHNIRGVGYRLLLD